MPNIQFSKPYYNVDESANTVAINDAKNVYFEALPQGGYSIRRRPGLLLANEPTLNPGGNGVYWSDRMQRLFIVTDGVVFYKATYSSNLIAIGSINSTGYPVVFAEGQLIDLKPILYFANGGQLHYLNGSTYTLAVPDSVPNFTTFVTMMNNRFYCNNTNVDESQYFYITDFNPDTQLNDPTFWGSSTNPWAAAQKPDNTVGLFTGWNEVYIWGSQACEPWQEDGVNPISPLIGSLMEIGLAAPYSVQKANNTFYALVTVGDKRAIITVAGRGPNVISEPIARQLQEYDNVSDAVGMMCFAGGLNMYVITFPSAGITWAFDIKTETWTQWSSWDLQTGTNKPFIGRYSAYAKTWNKHMVQAEDGVLYSFDRNTFTDNSSLIHSEVTTGWIDHGTWNRKRSNQLIIKLRGYLSSSAKLLMYTRTDGFPEWSVPIEINIEANSQNDHFCKLNRMGIYRSRQYRFVMTDAQNLALHGMEEDVTKMRD